MKITITGFLFFISYNFGYYLSLLIDKYFPECDLKNERKLIFLVIFQYSIAILIYSIISKYIFDKFKINIFNLIKIGYLNKDIYKSFFTILFSYGLFKNLNTFNNGVGHLYNKYINKN